MLASATGSESIALGAKSAAKGTNSSAVGAGTTASGADSVAAGYGATASAANTVAVGKGASATSTSATALGTESEAKADRATAIGKGAVAESELTVALGANSLAKGNFSFAAGVAAKTTTMNSIAIGTDAEMDGKGTGGGIAIGKNARALGKGAMAVGTSAKAEAAEFAVAMGDTARAYATNSLAVGVAAEAGEKTGDTKVTLSNGQEVSLPVGNSNVGVRASAFGREAKAKKNDSTALGALTQALQEGAVALGANSVANTNKGVVGYDITGKTDNTGNAWVSTTGAVSVGSSTVTRQITNVAAGKEDTDVVNVAQLKKAKVKVVEGDNVTVTEDTTKGYTEYKISSKATKTEVEGSGPVTVTPVAIDGGTKYTVGLSQALTDRLNNLPDDMNSIVNKLGVTNADGSVKTDLGIPVVNGSGNTNKPTTVVEAVNDVATAVNKGISLQGNDTTPINKKLGETFDVVGSLAADKEASSKNVRTKTNNGKLEILISETPEFKEVHAGTLAVKNADGTTGPKMTTAGIDAASKKITNVEAGSDDKDAVNFSQLKALKDVLGLAIGPDGQLTPEASAIRNSDGSLNNNPDLASTVRNQTTAINRGLVYGADTDEYKTLTNSNEGDSKKQQLGSTLAVKSATESLTKTGITGKEFVGTNLVTKYVRTADGNGLISIGMSDKPEFKEVSVFDPANPDKKTTLTPTGTTIKDGNKETNVTAGGTEVKDGDKTATYGADGIGLKGADGKTTTIGRNADGDLTVTKDSANPNSTPDVLATKADVEKAAKGTDGKDGKNGLDANGAPNTDSAGAKGLTGADGLNGKDLNSKVNALRNGEAGPIVYTAPDGTRLEKANDGKYYPADKVGDNGQPTIDAVAVDNPVASVVNADGTTTKPATMGNVKSTIGLDGKDGKAIDAATAQAAINGKDGQPGLLDKKGAELNNAATVGDLQALAQAGLDFTGNNAAEDQDVHRPLGTKLTIEGETTNANQTKEQFGKTAANNIHVESKKDENKLVISLAEDLKGINKVDFKPTEITNPDGTKTYAKAEISSAGNKYTETDKDGVAKPDGKTAEYGLNGAKVTEKDPTTGEAKESTYGADGLSTKALDKDGNVTGETTVTPEGVNLYGKDGKDGQDAKPVASLTNKVDADGKNNPSLAFAKDGEGDDAKGTGSITGLKDLERNPDGTAKDRTAAANAGYVDDRLKEMNEGKPFEYFEKDPATGEVKKGADGKPVQLVRGKDGNFYKPSELEGATYNPDTGKYEKEGAEITATPVDANNVTVQAMPSPTGKPLEMGNIGSGLGLNDSEEGNKTPLTADQAKEAMNGKDGKPGLLAQTGSSLNNAATVKDLQALAQAGLDFTGNNADEKQDVHRPLGTKLTIEGETTNANQTKEQFGKTAANNIHVESKKDENKLVISLAEDLKGINKVDFKPTEITNPDGTKTYAKAEISSAGNKYTETDKDGKPVENGKTSEYGLNGAKVTEKDPTTGETKETTMGADGTHATVKDKDGNPTKSADYTAEGSTVKAIDPATGKPTAESKYGADGLSTKALDKDGNVTGETTVSPTGVNLYGKDGKDGKDGVDGKPVASLTNTVDADGKNNPSLDFAKGEDGKGTGAITGLKDVERNPDGSAVDKTAAASTGYVDERLAEADAGKPFEYFDDKGNKVVRGQDGKFYAPETLEGKVYVERPDGTKGYVNRADKDKADVKPVDLTANEVNPQNVTIKAMPADADATPIAMGNVGSGLKLDNSKEGNAKALESEAAKEAIAGKDGKGGLLAQTGEALNNVATVKDLQALAQAGLDLTGNNTATTVHRPLGTKLVVEGETSKTAAVTKADFGATAKDNIHVEAVANGDTNKLVVSLAEDLKGINKVDFKPTEITNPDGTKTYAKAEISSAGNKYTETDKDGKPVENGKTSEYGLNGAKVTEKDPTTGETKETTMGADGTHATVKDKDGNPTKSADYTAEGSTVKAIDPATGKPTAESKYGADGLSTKALDKDGNVTGETTVSPTGVNLYGKDGKDGKDAKPVASLTNTVDADGKNNPSLDFAKGEDGKGTGAITGLKELERNADGTAKDKTAAATAGYVDDRINHVGKKLDRATKELRAGIAGANAAAGLPQVYIPGKSMVAASAGTFNGQSALAIGYSTASDSGKVIFKVQGNANTYGDVGGSVGLGYQW